ncbi:acetyl-CoA carboxylase biotin carboxyl carrier protein [Clostridium estertheticum]|uniref:Biotin carboxyl carrier protein of acetyl-CoA carboxylase n=1 Tax=Clostridium estertheticum TaxID=238834 RepID=A0A7Y3WST8_9CLOT|nr:acetyl-CoA carboxylase biotin carboxyl carrier protein [Clostridium estertheticum]MBX4267106.1 acetyl-CoA carboxylase biotin carboxyl carrier protein [Clostridium estertheticum]MBX4271671.1 acetyl-CoA carboxylase biotin carboxyl carrier protein [Clostridium estertheticum]NNU76305.1 acetyl-CoA carboxylase biotin carboxyl carrier protein [Clostridium estertheticum]WBL45800.1 acetyl-CoA carboxylase biotin carboxyl carrier protein [Clostridium estertheticum]WLC78845.1 acetyl-CoA carboxylase bio
MDYKNIQELIKTVSDTQITCFEIETDDIRIRMEKKEAQVVVERVPENVRHIETVTHEPLIKETIEMQQVYTKNKENAVSENAVKTIPDENIFIVKSPIVGTMYTSPSAESKNFVKVGSIVKVGDTLCILEAMKLMNEIESEVNGEVLEVLVSNEDMVEYGQPLFKIIKK